MLKVEEVTQMNDQVLPWSLNEPRMYDPSDL